MHSTPTKPELAELALNPLGMRFEDRGTEAAYRRWRNELILPFLRVAAIMSLISWMSVPAVIKLLFSTELFGQLELLLAYGFAVPVLALGLWGSFGWTRPYCVLVGSLVLAVLGLLYVQWFSLQVFNSVGGAVAGALVFSLTATFLRLPPLAAMLCTGPYTLAAILAAISSQQSGAISAGDSWAYQAMLGTGYLVVAGMTFFNERLQRQAFINEQIIVDNQRSLEQSRNLIRRYIPPAVAEQIIAGNQAAIDEPRRRRITVLFSDIVGFTDMADRVDPEVMTQVINEYMAAMAGIVDSHQGTVNEFIGDGLMAMFGAPNELTPEEQARQAMLSSQAMLEKLPELNARWRKLGLDEALKIRIGLNTGMVSVGSYGSQGRMSYTAIGLQVNVAARIQAHCEPGNILMSDATYQLICDEFGCEFKGAVDCKGVHYPVKVYAASPPTETTA